MEIIDHIWSIIEVWILDLHGFWDEHKDGRGRAKRNEDVKSEDEDLKSTNDEELKEKCRVQYREEQEKNKAVSGGLSPR